MKDEQRASVRGRAPMVLFACVAQAVTTATTVGLVLGGLAVTGVMRPSPLAVAVLITVVTVTTLIGTFQGVTPVVRYVRTMIDHLAAIDRGDLTGRLDISHHEF